VNRRFLSGRCYFQTADRHRVAAGRRVEIVRERPRTEFDDSLHLAFHEIAFERRMFRLLSSASRLRKGRGQKRLCELAERYRLQLPAIVNLAKQWIRERARGKNVTDWSHRQSHAAQTACNRHPRFGRSCALFSEPEGDTRSSYYLEDTATDFQVQE